jgi:dimethylamine/trimethylamine dehydrogenase
MVGQIKRGILDFIGGARPSIADPFLPQKIDEGREADIRECIGCNICISSWHDGVWVRCTQNPTAGEEWRRGWHPEKVAKDSAGSVLIVGGGPAGLEAGLTLARRGFQVSIAEKSRSLGGRLNWETSLPGLKSWNRVAEYRLGQLKQMDNVSLFPESEMTAQDVLDFGAEHVVVATGARWLKNSCGANELPSIPIVGDSVYTPDDLARGVVPEGPVAVFDFDNYYLGTAVAEDLASKGRDVTYITTAGSAAAWSFLTNELPLMHQALAKRGIGYRTLEIVTGFDGKIVELAQIFTGEKREIAAQSLVIVGQRVGGSALYDALQASDLKASGIQSLVMAGDAHAPGAIAHAVYHGHKTARELGLAASEILVQRDAPFAPRDFEPLRKAAE